MSVRKILVPLSGVSVEAPVIGTALAAARKFGAQVVGLFVRPDPTEALPYLGDGVSGQVIEQLMTAAKEASDLSSSKAREAFANAAQTAGVPLVQEGGAGTLPSARFLDVTGHRDDVVAAHAQLSDIIVFGEATSGVAGGSTLEAAMMSAGRPVLIAPKTAVPAIGCTVAIGWDDSPVAAHAVTAAMPFLDEAKKVIIFSIGRKELDPAPASMLADYLALHGVVADIHLVEAQGQPIGSVLLSNAEKAGADLLVVGGYGHSRLREFILGGATQHIRSHATIPVLMAH
ncbi:universal stress protein [Parvibaculum sedimenti]|uniref:Universal stress protein n=1 Tax=Parvibaculum sedimenti TaxID=2608632 RepID=A0A6N6VGA6_9HYPH|nr:universal stress protein [Parvibaculum sedimenti]KAB7739923.1 universal stress protein [Parvibaculum sedimenti]